MQCWHWSVLVLLYACVCVSQFWGPPDIHYNCYQEKKAGSWRSFQKWGWLPRTLALFPFFAIICRRYRRKCVGTTTVLGTNELDAGQLRGILPMFITFAHLRPSSRSAIFWMLVISVAGPWPRGNDQNPMFDDPGNHVKLRDERWHVYKICMHILMCRKLCARQFFGLCITIICTTSVFA